MRKWLAFFGIFLVLLGLLNLGEAIFNINLGKFFWPLVLVALGIWFLFRPKIFPGWGGEDFRFASNIRRTGAWRMTNEEHSTFVGDTLLDLTQADIPAGDSEYRMSGFVGDIKIILPETVGLSIKANCFVSEFDLFGEQMSNIMAPGEYVSPGFSSMEKRVHLVVNYFVTELHLVRS